VNGSAAMGLWRRLPLRPVDGPAEKLRAERGPRDLVEAGNRLRPRRGGKAHVVPQRGRRVGVAEPLLRLLDPFSA